jgi:hypothetical protein
VPLEFMTRENLLNGGRNYVNQFTQVLTDEIKASSLEKRFALANAGAVSWTTPDDAAQVSAGYARVRADGARRHAPLKEAGHAPLSSSHVLEDQERCASQYSRSDSAMRASIPVAPATRSWKGAVSAASRVVSVFSCE